MTETGRSGPGHGYPPMPPLADTAGPDPLLTVDTPEAARAALDAATRTVLMDGRSTALGVAGRVVGLGFFVLFVVVLEEGAGERTLTLVGLVAILVAWLFSVVDRVVGVTYPSLPWPIALALPTGLLGVGLALFLVSADLRWFFGLSVAVLALGCLTPVARWLRARGRQGVDGTSWPQGAQAFAILSVLERVASIAPSRLIQLAGLTPDAGGAWLDRLRSEQLLFGGRRRSRLFGDQAVFITEPGRERLARWRSELDHLAAGLSRGRPPRPRPEHG